LTDDGRARFLSYLSVLENVLADAQQLPADLPSEGLARA
jgi:hypothetical protein